MCAPELAPEIFKQGRHHMGLPLQRVNGSTYPEGVIFSQLGVTPRVNGLDAFCCVPRVLPWAG